MLADIIVLLYAISVVLFVGALIGTLVGVFFAVMKRLGRDRRR